MALDTTKTDPSLGSKIHERLVHLGVETPMVSKGHGTEEDKVARISRIIQNMHDTMQVLGLDLTDDSLSETPKRIAKMFINEIFWGLDYNNFPKVTTIENKMDYETMLLERNIAVKSTCEHHFLPFMGSAYIAYIPNNTIIGLSKINRIVEFFSRRPQVQERLTEQVFHALCYILDTDSVAVCIRAEHSCVKLRGIEDTNSDTITSRLGGAFLTKHSLRNEFYQSIKI